jgi:hypothetical protein
MNRSRRTFIFAGVLGAAALAATRFFPRAPVPATHMALDGDATAIVAALAPVMLDGALPDEARARDDALRETVAAVDRAVSGLPPLAQHELGQLFALLASAPGRWSLAHMTSSWDEASRDDVERFLVRLRDSRLALLRAAYDALHQLILAAWYGNPRAWPTLGYSGPPVLG